MNFRILLLIFFSGTVLSPIFAQVPKGKSKTIVDDSTKVIYGTTTSLIYTSESVFKENRVFFNKDTVYISTVKRLKPNFDLDFKRPTLYTPEEFAKKAEADSLAKKLSREAKRLEQTRSDTTTYFKKDTSSSLANRLKSWLRKKKSKPVSYESRFFKNEYFYSKTDTSIDRIQQYNMVYINDNIYQNLGVICTPSKPVFYTQPQTIGYQSGFKVYDVYYTDPTKVKYYNSKSPFTNIYYVGNPGATNEDRIKIDINRNVSRHWNIGFSYERIYTDKLIGQSGSNSRSLALGQEFIFYTSTKSRNGRYHFMANANYFLFFNNEQGGFSKENPNNTGTENQTLVDTRLPRDIAGWPTELNAVSFGVNASNTAGKIFSRDRRVSYYVYHQYDILKLGKLTAFHEFDRRNQRYTFGDAVSSISTVSNDNFYKGTNLLLSRVKFNQEFAFLSNKIGLKSRWNDFIFAGYYKHRYVTSSKGMDVIKAGDLIVSPFVQIGNWIDDPNAKIRLNEHYLGGYVKYKIQDSISLEFNGELMTSLYNNSDNSKEVRRNDVVTTTSAIDTISTYQYNPYANYKYMGDYNFNFKATIKDFDIGASFMRYAPSLINYYSLQHNLYHWYKPLNATISNSLYARYRIRKKDYYFEVNPSVFQIQNYVYFNEFIEPTQTASNQPLYYGFLDVTFNTHIGILHFDTRAKYTFIPKSNLQVIRMPEFYVNPRIYFKYVPKTKVNKQDFRFGFDIYYRSGYYGDVYMPSIGQFYVQNSANDNSTNFKLQDNVLVDFFITAKLRNARVFLKFNQINQLAGLTTGYYISPYYPAIGGSFQFGVHWLLFD